MANAACCKLASAKSSIEVLVVDDSEDVRLLLRTALEEEGYAVRCVGNGLEALNELRAGNAPDLIILDLTMPVMNGLEFLNERIVDDALRAIPVVVVSASVHAREAALGKGISAFLRKPVGVDSLVQAVASALDAGRQCYAGRRISATRS